MKTKQVKYTPNTINGWISTVSFALVLDSDHTACITPLWTRHILEDHSSHLRQSEIHSMDNPHGVFVLVKAASETEY